MESNYLAISIGHQSMFLKNVLFKPFLGKGWWEFKHPLLRSGSSSNYWGLTHIQTFFEVRRRKNSEEQENKFLNPDQWSGKGPPESWLAILGCKHAPDFEKIRSSIPELWQGQCIIYAELKPQEAFQEQRLLLFCALFHRPFGMDCTIERFFLSITWTDLSTLNSKVMKDKKGWLLLEGRKKALGLKN